MENQFIPKATFKENYKDFAILCRELMLVREHNKKFESGEDQKYFLIYSEAMLTLLTLERFLRVIPALKAKKSDFLKDLLKRALDPKNPILVCPGCDIDILIKEINGVRNTLVHGNFEQAALECGLASKDEYLKTQLLPEIETIFKILEILLDQIDIDTGETRA